MLNKIFVKVMIVIMIWVIAGVMFATMIFFAKQEMEGCIIALIEGLFMVFGLFGAALLTGNSAIGGIILLVIACIPLVIGFVVAIKERKENKEYEEHTRKIEFYRECVQNGIVDFSKPAEVEKAKLIAGKYELYNVNVRELYLEGKEWTELREKRDKEAEWREKRREEQKLYNESIKYSDYSGRDKRLAMLQDALDAVNAEIEKMDKMSSMAYHMTKSQEVNSGFVGGIVSGLAGPAAGVAAAVNTEIQNAEARAQSAADREAMKPLQFGILNNKLSLNEQKDNLESAIAAAKTKLCELYPEGGLAKKIEITDTKLEVSETGMVTVSCNIRCKENVYVYENTPAVIDGVFKANLYLDDKIVGSAPFVLPVYGVGTTSVKVTGMCLLDKVPAPSYTAKYEAVNLWAIEK